LLATRQGRRAPCLAACCQPISSPLRQRTNLRHEPKSLPDCLVCCAPHLVLPLRAEAVAEVSATPSTALCRLRQSSARGFVPWRGGVAEGALRKAWPTELPVALTLRRMPQGRAGARAAPRVAGAGSASAGKSLQSKPACTAVTRCNRRSLLLLLSCSCVPAVPVCVHMHAGLGVCMCVYVACACALRVRACECACVSVRARARACSVRC
jgi:hypothetical protein